MDDFGTLLDANTVRFERLLPGPIERVWAYLTQPQFLRTWLAASTMDLRVGGAVELRFDTDEVPERAQAGAIDQGIITRYEPPHALAYTWQKAKAGAVESHVTLELEAVEHNVRLVLTHRRLPSGANISFGAGWHTHLAVLQARLQGVEPPPFLPLFDTLLPIYQQIATPERSQMNETTVTSYLQIVRRFDVAPEVVFDAFTNPATMRIWWTAQTTFDIDLRVGGRWTITRTDGETVYVMTGEYLAIARPYQLTYTIAMPQFSPNSDTLEITITPEQTGCVVTFGQRGEDIASELAALAPGEVSASEVGWQQGFDLMAAAWQTPAE